MATEPQTNPSQNDPLLDKYEKFKNKAQAFETAVESKREKAEIMQVFQITLRMAFRE